MKENFLIIYINKMECPICFYVWNQETTMPLILNCGHSICIKCSRSLFSVYKIVCPTCSIDTLFSFQKQINESEEDFITNCIDSLTKNYTLLSLVCNKSSIKGKMREYRYGMRCKEHNLMIHSYVSKPFSLLCNKCLEEISNFNLKVVPLPEVLEICRDSISKLKRNVEKLEQDSNKNEEESIETIKNDLEDYFTRIHKKVKDANGQAKETLLEKVKIFKEETKIQHKKCEEMISKTKINEQRLNYLLTLPLGNLLQEKEAVDNLYALSKESTSGLILSSFAVELQLKQDSLSVFKEFIKNSISIKLKKSSKEAWTCMKCNKNIVEGKIRCECGGFRSIESYQNIITNIYECSQVEISEIQQRREIEMNLINELDDSKENNLWYIINADWVSD